MSAKKLDLGSYKTGTKQTQPKHSKYSSFLENDAESGSSLPINNQPVAASSEKPEKKASPSSARKADSAKRINMAFYGNNYISIQEKTDASGLTAAYFISELVKSTNEAEVEKFINAQPVRITKEHVSRRRGMPAKRINIRFDAGAYSKMKTASERLGITITQYVNSVISLADEKAHR